MDESLRTVTEPSLLAETPDFLELSLVVREAEMITDLCALREGRARTEFALTALRIGLLALRQARGQVDVAAIRREGERMMAGLQGRLDAHRDAVQSQLTGSLREYFDPESGRFEERVQRLVRRDGELETLLRRQIGGDESELCRTLAAHFGDQSPLMKLLSPTESEGLLRSLSETLGDALQAQRERILREFSLDTPESALSRLVRELGERHGKLHEEIQGALGGVVKEFSLDREDSALSRLVIRVEGAQRTISQEFSLNDEGSALARMKRELLGVLETHAKTARDFQEEVKTALASIVSRRQEAERSTRHGVDFEAQVAHFVATWAQREGDIPLHVGDTVGLIKNCKKGDCVVELGPESCLPGAKIVIEAKEVDRYPLDAARSYIEEARKNRGAEVGLFVYSRKNAPAGMGNLRRIAADVFVVWDAEEPATDLWFEAGLTVARALCTRGGGARERRASDFEAIERAVLEIEKRAEGFSEVETLTRTIQGNSEKVLHRIDLMRKAFRKEVDALREHFAALRDAAGGAPG